MRRERERERATKTYHNTCKFKCSLHVAQQQIASSSTRENCPSDTNETAHRGAQDGTVGETLAPLTLATLDRQKPRNPCWEEGLVRASVMLGRRKPQRMMMKSRATRFVHEPWFSFIKREGDKDRTRRRAKEKTMRRGRELASPRLEDTRGLEISARRE